MIANRPFSPESMAGFSYQNKAWRNLVIDSDKKNIQLRELTSCEMENIYKPRAITTEDMVRYGPLLNLKKSSWY